MHLAAVPVSAAVKAAIDAMARQIDQQHGRRKKPSPAYLLALEAIVGDGMRAMAVSPPLACYRRMGSGSFKGKRIGFHPFKRAIDNLRAAGFVEVITGKAPWGDDPGFVTRIIFTIRFTEFLAAYGIRPADWRDHFSFANAYLDSEPVRLRAASKGSGRNKVRGKAMPADLTNPRAVAFKGQMRRINAYFATQRFSINEVVLYRGFNNGDDPAFNYDMGGRIFCEDNPYLSLSKEERADIRINDDPIAELDVSSCFLTIVHGHLGIPLPNSLDLYAVDGFKRDIIKEYVNGSFGLGKPMSQWSYEKKTPNQRPEKHARIDAINALKKAYRIKDVAAAVKESMPILQQALDAGFGWAKLQYIESQIMADTIETLALEHQIPALPVHDSILITVSGKDQTLRVLTDSFLRYAFVHPIIKQV